MASGGMVPSSVGKPRADAMLVDKLPEEINEMKIKDEKVEKVKSTFPLESGINLHRFLKEYLFLSGSCRRKWKLQWWMEMELKLATLLLQLLVVKMVNLSR